jgi:acetyl esterase/lipase
MKTLKEGEMPDTPLNDRSAPEGWPTEIKPVEYKTAADNTMQPALFVAPPNRTAAPLLVSLHVWGGDYKPSVYNVEAVRWCVANGWAVIQPDYRGPYTNAASMGSDLAVADIVSAVDYAKAHANVDAHRICLLGASGGGHAALLMAGRAPEIWAGVSSWVGISDLVDFYHESKAGAKEFPYKGDLVKHMEDACGGPPGASPAVDAQYRHRSPVTWLAGARNVALDINNGAIDGIGAGGTVIATQGFKAFNAVVDPRDRIPESVITRVMQHIDFANKELLAEVRQNISDPLYGARVPQFRAQSGQTRFTIFKGGHEMAAETAMKWLEQQRKP